jgi:hypothetical protein
MDKQNFSGIIGNGVLECINHSNLFWAVTRSSNFSAISSKMEKLNGFG